MPNKKLIRSEAKHAALVHAAWKSNGRQRLHEAQRMYLHSFAARYVAAREAKLMSSMSTHKKTKKIARDMNLFKRCSEVVQLDMRRKPNTEFDYRFIMRFGPEQQARQILLRNMLKARFGTAAAQTVFAGGRDAAARRLKEYYSVGYVWIQEFDIARCFNSFRMDKAASFLSLPGRVCENVLTTTTLNIRPSLSIRRNLTCHSPNDDFDPMDFIEETFRDDWDRARQGLIEGSRVSPFVAELLLAPVCEALSECSRTKVINYADNFLLMAKTPRGLKTIADKLQDELCTHPVGPLQVNPKTSRNGPNDSFDFLGYRCNPDDGKLVFSWSEQAEAKARKLRKRAHKKLTSKTPFDDKLAIFEKVQRRHQGLVGAYPLWKDRQEFHQQKMAKLQLHLGEEGSVPNRRRRRNVAVNAGCYPHNESSSAIKQRRRRARKVQ
ncbi:hypothetical protein [Sulfitobacter mediterraneus]|uniref:hypothetical protein n=1 Tax=Sulfitobacter mediterraneus TaxID=83219 RepID=UPI0013C417A2|nr:hypothetical protein [Sulfitobacter mediterraneus]